MQDVQELLQRLEVADGLSLVALDGGAVLELESPAASARIAMQGAQVLSWTPRGHDEALWCSTASALGGGKAIRGGIPICWPWFGPHATDVRRPQHGFARNVAWHLDDVMQSEVDGRTVLTFRLPFDIAERGHGPGDLAARLFVEVGTRLVLRLETENEGDAAAPLSGAFHSYFGVGHAGEVMVDGLDGRQYRDNTAGGVRRRQSGSMRIRGETVALFDQGGQTLRLVDPLRKRSIVIEAGPQTPSTIVWNPGASAAALADIPSGEESRFVCIESGFIGAERVMLQPGDAHEMSVSYRLEPL